MNYENFLAQALHGAMPDAKAMVNAVNAGSDDKLGARITDLERALKALTELNLSQKMEAEKAKAS